MVDRELLSRKISKLSYYISELKNAKDINWKKYTDDSRSKAFVERYLHLAIEEVFDMGAALLRHRLTTISSSHNIPRFPSELLDYSEMASFG